MSALPHSLTLSDKSQRGNREPKKPKQPPAPAPIPTGHKPAWS